jgi:flagellar basal-body rod modification protein FlgD
MISPTSATGQSSSGTSATTTPAANDPLAQKDLFLKLLIAQIKNQDPMNPGDSMQYITQLAQFSELEQLAGMHTDLDTIAGAVNQAAQPASAGDGTNSTKETT